LALARDGPVGAMTLSVTLLPFGLEVVDGPAGGTEPDALVARGPAGGGWDEALSFSSTFSAAGGADLLSASSYAICCVS